MNDEPLVVPVSPGSALVRLAQVGGALQRHDNIARALPDDALHQLHSRRGELLAAIESGERGAIEDTFRAAQNHLRRLYEAVSQPGLWSADEAPAVYAALGFPDPLRNGLHAVDVSSVLVTFSMPHRQVLTTLSFQDAPGATAYWLREIRVINGLEVEDPTVSSYAPIFTRQRMPSGPHRLRIESRDNSTYRISEEFEIIVPEQVP
jgi:hypothetical protein